MPYIPEITIAVLILAGILFFALNNLPQYKNQKLLLLAKYRRVRSKSLKLQDALSLYIIKNDALKSIFSADLTYGQCLKQIQKSHALYLSEKKYARLKTSNNRIFLSRTNRSLTKQEHYLDQMEKELTNIL